jgi:hypothetical protein
MEFVLLFVMLAGYAILKANLPTSQSGDRVVSPNQLPLLLGNPAKLKFSEVRTAGCDQVLRVEARTPTGLLLTFSRNTGIRPPETQIQVSKAGWMATWSSTLKARSSDRLSSETVAPSLPKASEERLALL